MESKLHQKRRSRLVRGYDMPIVMTAHTQLQRKGDAAYGFDQEPNFWYLTGISEPDWWLIIYGKKAFLVQPDVSEVQRLFEGGMSASEAKEVSGVDDVIDRKQAMALIGELASVYKSAATILPDKHSKYFGFMPNPVPAQMTRRLKRLFEEVIDCRLELSKQRAIKQPEEIAAITRAVNLTVSTFESVKKQLPRLEYEYEIEAEFSYAFRRSGATGHAYDPIVAGGMHACTLHYGANQDRLPANGLVLIDIGVRVDGYAADITRTYAIGTPTDRQIAVHSAVEAAHHEIIALLRPGLDVREYHERVDSIMKRALIGLGLMKEENDNAYRTYFPHAISHGLGIDVHDSLGRPEVFSPGMVLTVEPGIYIPEEGIGVRIEDNILITESGHRNLSSALSTSL